VIPPSRATAALLSERSPVRAPSNACFLLSSDNRCARTDTANRSQSHSIPPGTPRDTANASNARKNLQPRSTRQARPRKMHLVLRVIDAIHIAATRPSQFVSLCFSELRVLRRGNAVQNVTGPSRTASVPPHGRAPQPSSRAAPFVAKTRGQLFLRATRDLVSFDEMPGYGRNGRALAFERLGTEQHAPRTCQGLRGHNGAPGSHVTPETDHMKAGRREGSDQFPIRPFPLLACM
jgi:hypothetical protein